jgi:hypothetical protein
LTVGSNGGATQATTSNVGVLSALLGTTLSPNASHTITYTIAGGTNGHTFNFSQPGLIVQPI